MGTGLRRGNPGFCRNWLAAAFVLVAACIAFSPTLSVAQSVEEVAEQSAADGELQTVNEQLRLQDVLMELRSASFAGRHKTANVDALVREAEVLVGKHGDIRQVAEVWHARAAVFAAAGDLRGATKSFVSAFHANLAWNAKTQSGNQDEQAIETSNETALAEGAGLSPLAVEQVLPPGAGPAQVARAIEEALLELEPAQLDRLATGSDSSIAHEEFDRIRRWGAGSLHGVLDGSRDAAVDIEGDAMREELARHPELTPFVELLRSEDASKQNLEHVRELTCTGGPQEVCALFAGFERYQQTTGDADANWDAANTTLQAGFALTEAYPATAIALAQAIVRWEEAGLLASDGLAASDIFDVPFQRAWLARAIYIQASNAIQDEDASPILQRRAVSRLLALRDYVAANLEPDDLVARYLENIDLVGTFRDRIELRNTVLLGLLWSATGAPEDADSFRRARQEVLAFERLKKRLKPGASTQIDTRIFELMRAAAFDDVAQNSLTLLRCALASTCKGSNEAASLLDAVAILTAPGSPESGAARDFIRSLAFAGVEYPTGLHGPGAEVAETRDARNAFHERIKQEVETGPGIESSDLTDESIQAYLRTSSAAALEAARRVGRLSTVDEYSIFTVLPPELTDHGLYDEAMILRLAATDYFDRHEPEMSLWQRQNAVQLARFVDDRQQAFEIVDEALARGSITADERDRMLSILTDLHRDEGRIELAADIALKRSTRSGEPHITILSKACELGLSAGNSDGAAKACSGVLDWIEANREPFTSDRLVDGQKLLGFSWLGPWAKAEARYGDPEVATSIGRLMIMLGRLADSDDLALAGYEATSQALEAGGDYQAALEVFDAASDTRFAMSAWDRLRHARLARLAGKPQVALAEAEAANEEVRKRLGEETAALAYPAFETALSFDALGRTDEALSTMERVLELLRDDENMLGSTEATSGFSDLENLPDLALDTFLRLASDSDADAERVFRQLQASRSSALTGLARRAVLEGRQADSQAALLLRELRNVEASLRDLSLSLSRAVESGEDGNGVQTAPSNAAALRQKADELSAEIAARVPEYEAIRSRPSVSLGEVQKALPADAGLLVVQAGETGTASLLVTVDNAEWHRAAISRDGLDKLVRKLRASLAPFEARGAESLQATAAAFPFEAAAEIHKVLLTPLDAFTRLRRIYIVANSPLDALPFGALIDSSSVGSGPVPWLIRTHAFARLSGVSIIPQAGDDGHSREAFLGLGDPDFAAAEPATTTVANLDPMTFNDLYRGGSTDTQSLAGLRPLPESGREVRAIAEAMGAGEDSLLLGPQATEAELRKRLRQPYRLIDLATHGLVAGEISALAEPALAMTPGPDGNPEDDGLLRMSEIATLPIDAQLVVLSACSTAAGDGTPGAGALSGLARAFFLAGADALVVSNWAVNSGAAERLAVGAAERIAAQNADQLRMDALRKSILAILDRPGAPASEKHPSYWAPFSLIEAGIPAGDAAARN